MKFADKQEIFEKVKSALDQNLKVLVDSAFEAKEASTNEESKAENKYDTRGLEASYLAAGQAQRAQQLQETIYLTKKINLKKFLKEDPISISALVRVEINEKTKRWFLILPIGGVDVEYENETIQTITLDSPVGRLLHNSFEGDDFTINKNEYEIIEVI